MAELHRLMDQLSSLGKDEADRAAIADLITSLDDRYHLSAKISREPGVEEIIK